MIPATQSFLPNNKLRLVIKSTSRSMELYVTITHSSIGSDHLVNRTFGPQQR
jgi:hypothetical protein